MRRYWLGISVLWLAAGCMTEGKLRPRPGAVPLSEDENAAVAGAHGVRLVAHGSNWKARPQDIERHFTVMEIRLENDSGRPLNIRYEGFELEGKSRYVARKPEDLHTLLSARAARVVPDSDVYGTALVPPGSMAAAHAASLDMTYTSYNGVTPYTAPPCITCPSTDTVAGIPSPDMRRLALQEGALADGQARDGFLYFEEPLLLEKHVTLKVKLTDASNGEQFGTLRIPFEVR